MIVLRRTGAHVWRRYLQILYKIGQGQGSRIRNPRLSVMYASATVGPQWH